MLKPAPATRPTCRPFEGSRFPWKSLCSMVFCCNPIVGVPCRSRSCGSRAGLSRIGDHEPTRNPGHVSPCTGPRLASRSRSLGVRSMPTQYPGTLVSVNPPDPLLTSGPHAVLARTGKLWLKSTVSFFLLAPLRPWVSLYLALQCFQVLVPPASQVESRPFLCGSPCP